MTELQTKEVLTYCFECLYFYGSQEEVWTIDHLPYEDGETIKVYEVTQQKGKEKKRTGRVLYCQVKHIAEIDGWQLIRYRRKYEDAGESDED